MIVEFSALIASEPWVLLEFSKPEFDRTEVDAALLKLQKQVSPEVVVIKADVNENPHLAEFYKVDFIPEFILFRDGKEVYRKRGVLRVEEILTAMC